jgi:hypothetical protein
MTYRDVLLSIITPNVDPVLHMRIRNDKYVLHDRDMYTLINQYLDDVDFVPDDLMLFSSLNHLHPLLDLDTSV